MQENKVISSNISRAEKPLQNNLYDLIKIIPAKPIQANYEKEHSCDFLPVTGKVYVPKRNKNRYLKVKTVRDIRVMFESDIYTDLTKDLEKQQNILLKKITCGSSREENTKGIARNMLKCDKPVSRSAWQMIMNVNPEGHTNPIQYALWNGRRVRINGSKGGRNKFICNYDLAKVKISTKTEKQCRSMYKKKELLKNSLTVKFKPGPLRKKIFLDDSYQKYNVGKTELVNIPKPGLDVQPLYGVPLETNITNFVQGLRETNGVISKKWAEYAVSVLGTIKDTEAVQASGSCVTFELNYKLDQHRMLMRRDIDNNSSKTSGPSIQDSNLTFYDVKDDEKVTTEVTNMLNDILTSVEISLQQDNMFSGEDEPRAAPNEVNMIQTTMKDKSRRRYMELDRLAVTVIRLPDDPENDANKSCNNAHCSLGCLCASLQCSYNLKQHCGRLECMFECKCDFRKYKVTDAFDNNRPELLPGLINLDNQLNSKLAKEEQKFHQTVVVTGEKSILLKSERRNWKTTKRYGDFYDSMCLKNDEEKVRRILSISEIRLNCENIEPWCMVHNLYKCFCKGKFTQASSPTQVNEVEVNKTVAHDEDSALIKSHEICSKELKRISMSSDKNNSITRDLETCELNDLESTTDYYYITSARTRPYAGRKYINGYYRLTHQKILEMEENDDQLRKKMLSILNKSDTNETLKQPSKTNMQCENMKITGFSPVIEGTTAHIEGTTAHIEGTTAHIEGTTAHIEGTTALIEGTKQKIIAKNLQEPSIELNHNSTKMTTIADKYGIKDVTPDRSILNATSNKAKLISWLESSYQQYKRRIQQGVEKKSLDPPKQGKVALYPWEFILSRYRERKNLFLVSKQKPFRIFMAVNSKNAFFDNCINIDDIRFAELYLYPVTVKNLLTNATDLKDNFCILCGLPHCWELIGSVTKLDDHTTATDQLQSVSDDGKIGFVAQDREQGNSIESQETTLTELNSTSNTKDQSNIQQIANIGNRKRKKNNKRSKKRKAKKNKIQVTDPNIDIENDQVNMKEQLLDKDNNIDDTQEHSTSNASDTSAVSSPTNNIKDTTDKLGESVLDEIEDSHLNSKSLQVHDLIETDATQCLTSKWFVMTVENDFSEIQFYKRGFFVKYESIIKAINVARLSGKTVRLSPPGSDPITGPQFGIYAIPNSSEFYVFIGPYDVSEPLGIETVKTVTDLRKTKRTTGVWITTKKMDNSKVIDNPLSFMPNNMHDSKIVPLENETIMTKAPETKPTNRLKSNISKDIQQKDPIKVVKPIKISKANGFYQWGSQGLLTQVLSKPNDTSANIKSCTANLVPVSSSLLQPLKLQQIHKTKMPVMQIPLPPLCYPANTGQSLLKKVPPEDTSYTAKPVAEIAPQIKIIDVYSESTSEVRKTNDGKKSEPGSMFVLKPEEINKRLMQKKLSYNPKQSLNAPGCSIQSSHENMDQDIEKFLATSTAYMPPYANIFEISDDEDDQELNRINNWQQIWIECETANIGYIRGHKNDNNEISFEFPGFKFTEFYAEEEAFMKINQVISRKIYVPKSLALKWRICETFDSLKRKYEIETGNFGPDLVLTRQGVRHKQDVIAASSKYLKAYAASKANVNETVTSKTVVDDADNDTMSLIKPAEDTSNETMPTKEATEDSNDETKTSKVVPEDADDDPVTSKAAPENSDNDTTTATGDKSQPEEFTKAMIKELEEKSKILEQESDLLMNEFNQLKEVSKESDPLQHSDAQKELLSKALKVIATDNL